MTSRNGSPPKNNQNAVQWQPAAEKGTLKIIAGSLDDRFNNQVANAALNTAWRPKDLAQEERDKLISAVVNGMVYLGSDDGNLYAFGLHNQQRSDRFRLPERPDPALLLPNGSLPPKK